MNDQFLSKLKCPNDGSALKNDDDSLRGVNSGVSYPVFEGVPFLLPFPLASLNEWAAKVRVELLKIKRQVASLDHQIKDPQLSAAAAERLKNFSDGLVQYEKAILELITPLDLDLKGSAKVQSAFLSSIPTSQKPFGYATNFFRDWSWGQKECDTSLSLIKELRPFCEGSGKFTGLQWAVIGSGFGRLSYDVHREFKNDMTVLLDLNPFSILSSKKMTSEGAMTWVEFPRIPKDPRNAAVVQTCKADPIEDDRFFHIIGDGARPPLAMKSFDCVLTPWFIDIVPDNLQIVMSEVNRILRKGGKWIQIGPLSFEGNLQKNRPSEEELFELAGDQGFKMLSHFDKQVPYLQSPYSRSYEVKTVTAFCLEKIQDAQKIESEGWNYLPPWLEDLTLPIVKTDNLSAQMQLNEMISKMLRLIDGKKSVLDLADELGEKYNADKGELVEAIRIYLTRLSDANLFRYGNDDGSANL